MSSVREHPWLGTGFGTSATGIDVSNDFSSFRSSARSTREHGNSYLATLEWVGIIGVGPFVILVFLIAVNVGRLLVRIRHSGNALSPLVPLVGVVLAGLVNAAFEDWLFAAGYYLCVLFWGLAFVLDDFVYISDQLAAS
jgi:O-antigen ligase